MTTEKPLYLDHTKPVNERVDDLVSRMTLEEKFSQMLHTAGPVERLGVPEYDWWSECLHGVARNGRATVFPQAIAMAATFDTAVMQRIGDAIASEGRAKYHAAVARGNRGRCQGLTFWTPNINIFRDARWGRGQETYGEDPFLTGEIGAAFVKGLQGDHPKYLKAAACAKHYAVHSGPEKLRHTFDAIASPKDLYETYLPAFKRLVEAGVEAVMGAYNRTNGEPCCGSKTLLVDILRGAWGFKGHVVSDCWAVRDIHENHKVVETPEEAAAMAVKNGCDLNCGCTYTALGQAVDKGLIAEADIDACVKNLMRTRFKLGMFDPAEENPYASIPESVIGCDEHRALAREACAKSVVLLKNSDSLLPISSEAKRIYVVGPNAASVDVLLGNYYGVSPRLTTILEGIVGHVPEGVCVEYRPGILLARDNVNPVDWSTGEAKSADVVIAVLGLTGYLEGEEGDAIESSEVGDRGEIGLPPNQKKWLRKLKDRGSKIVLVVTGGSPIAITEEHEWVDAVVYAWYPGEEGGNAIADVLFGNTAPSGRLPFTVPASMEQVPPFEDYSMKNRTYRYMTGEPLYPFGFGLSYTRFAYSDPNVSAGNVTAGEPVEVSCTVANTGERDGEEVVQLYLSDLEASTQVPKHRLVGFRRIALKAGESRNVSFTLRADNMNMIDDRGEAVLEPGTFRLAIGGASPGERSRALGAAEPAVVEFEVQT